MSHLTADLAGVILACPACGQKNRRPYAKLTDEAHCGKCGEALPPPSAPVDIPSTAVFDALRESASLPVLVDFWAAWCGPCRMLAPQLEQVAVSEAGRVLIVKVDTEALAGLAARFQVQSIPLLLVLRGGREVARQAGALSAPQLRGWLSAI